MVSTEADIEARVFAMIAAETGRRLDGLLTSARLENDLGCTGDDAERLIVRLQSEFEIDMSVFEFLHHFSPEVKPWPAFGYGLFLGWMSVCLLAIVGRYLSFEIPAWLVGGGFVGPAILGWLVMRRYRWTDPYPVKTELTVADLVNAASSRRRPSALVRK